MSEKEVIVGGYHYRCTNGEWVVGAVGTGNATPTTWPHTVAMLERIHALEARAEAGVTEAEAAVIDAAIALVTDDPSDPWGYQKDVQFDTLRGEVVHYIATRGTDAQ